MSLLSQRNTELETALRAQVVDLRAQLSAERQRLDAAQQAAEARLASERVERSALDKRVAELAVELAQREAQVRCCDGKEWQSKGGVLVAIWEGPG